MAVDSKLRNILHTRIVANSGGGPDKTILYTPRNLIGTGYSATACYFRSPKLGEFQALRDRASELDCPLIEIDDRLKFDPLALYRLVQVCKDNEITILHGHDYKTNLYGVLVAKMLGIKTATTVHGWVTQDAKTSVYYKVDEWAIRRHDLVVCVSIDLYEQCLAFGVPEKRLRLIENAIDTEHFRRRSKRPLRGTVCLGAMGRLSKEKAFDNLIEAVASLIDNGLDVELAIGGEGPEYGALKALIDRRGMAGHIRLLGFVADIPHFFEGLDVFVLSSLREGLPNVILEAMAMDVPVITTDCGGITNVVKDGQHGVVVPAGNVAALRDAISETVQNTELLDRLSREGRKLVEEKYSFKVRMSKMVSAYDECLFDTHTRR